MTKLPSRLATPPSEMATLRKSTMLLEVKLNNTKIMINFQNEETSAFRPARPYTIEPRMNGGITRSGIMSNRTYRLVSFRIQRIRTAANLPSRGNRWLGHNSHLHVRA